MSKVYRFAFDDEFQEDCLSNFPQANTVKQRIYVKDESTWVPILWQFCKFLEATGYEGVKEKVVIKDPYGMHGDDLFETIGPEDDEELDEEIEEAVDDYFEDEERANY